MNDDHTGHDAIPHNQLLAALPADEQQRWAPHLEPVRLSAGRVLCDSGETPAYVHFPASAVVSLMFRTRDGGSAELAVVGDDGMVGIAVIMDGDATPCAAVVQTGGLAVRLRSTHLKSLLQRSVPALQVLLLYARALMAQAAQTALCNRYRSIDQQSSRRLLLGFDPPGSLIAAMCAGRQSARCPGRRLAAWPLPAIT